MTNNALIILVLLATVKTVLTKYVADMAQWLVYQIIANLSYEIRK